MITRRKLKAENERLKQENATLKVWLRAYKAEHERQQEDIALLNASLDATVASMERWEKLARKADERRKRYVLGNMARAD